MKWFQSLFILFLLSGLPLFQMEQAVDIEWLVCERFLIIKPEEMNEPSINQNLWFDSKPSLFYFNQVKFFSQFKNPLSILVFYFQGTSPCWRPPPIFRSSLF
jgi:hypothetical protein